MKTLTYLIIPNNSFLPKKKNPQKQNKIASYLMIPGFPKLISLKAKASKTL